MSSIATDASHGVPGGNGNEHGHPPFLAHHFETPSQQYSSAKLGMWVFLGTELLMFGGLFVAYAVYRHSHPEVFTYAHVYLNKWWGGLNTIILLVSSFTMAWGVRAAQLGQQRLLAILLTLTILGGAGFMCIKYVEYKNKWEHNLFPGGQNVFHKEFSPPKDETRGGLIEHIEHLEGGGEAHAAPQALAPAAPTQQQAAATSAEHAQATVPTHPTTTPAAQAAFKPLYIDPNAGTGDEPKIKANFVYPTGLAPREAHRSHLKYTDLEDRDKTNVATFFSIYFMMTGLHGIHVLVGMGLIAWVLVRSFRGEFGPAFYTPVDLVGLYWHLVDLIWIFLFPLLYLIT